MDKQASITPLKLKRIELVYETGTKLLVEETKDLAVGNLFFSLLKEKQLHWQVVEPGYSVKQKIKSFFNI